MSSGEKPASTSTAMRAMSAIVTTAAATAHAMGSFGRLESVPEGLLGPWEGLLGPWESVPEGVMLESIGKAASLVVCSRYGRAAALSCKERSDGPPPGCFGYYRGSRSACFHYV